MSDKIKTGSRGENLAADFLCDQGFEIVARNYRFNRGEIDLIAMKPDWLVFVEVKTRSSFDYGEPEQFVTDFKARKIYEAAEAFIFKIDWHGHVRFDVISVKLNAASQDVTEIKHFEDAIN
jgi:putative endonuclease